MDARKIPYFSINRCLLQSIGLLPTDANTLRRVQQFIVGGILLSSFYPQIGALIKYRSNFTICCKIVMCVMITLICSIKYFNFVCSTKNRLRRTLEWLQTDWETYTRREEREILKEHGKNGRMIVIIHLIIIYPALFASAIFPYVRHAYNNLMQPNRTNLLRTPIVLEYYILNEDKHIQWIMLHATTFNIMGTHAVVVTEMLSLVVVEHVCALFGLVSHYVCAAIEETIAHPNKLVVHRYTKTIVLVHYRALGFMTYLNENYMLHYCALLVIGVITLSLNIYIFAKSIMNTDDLDTLILSVVYIICHFSYMLSCCYAGQKVMDVSSYISTGTYCSRWYLTPLAMQKFLILFLERSLKTTCFISGGLLTPNLELLSSALSTSMSYFMVLWSLS